MDPYSVGVGGGNLAVLTSGSKRVVAQWDGGTEAILV